PSPIDLTEDTPIPIRSKGKGRYVDEESGGEHDVKLLDPIDLTEDTPVSICSKGTGQYVGEESEDERDVKSLNSDEEETGSPRAVHRRRPGKKGCGWPQRYFAVQLKPFFDDLELNLRGETQTEIFYRHFPELKGIPYPKSQVTSHRNRWKDAGLELQGELVKAGRTPKGSWTYLMGQVHDRQNAVRSSRKRLTRAMARAERDTNGEGSSLSRHRWSTNLKKEEVDNYSDFSDSTLGSDDSVRLAYQELLRQRAADEEGF
ncbi:hypothetical protein MPER_06143, partial [Moniliophthora perniciosa FA553]